MADIQGEEVYLSHSGQEIDDCIDEVAAARGGQENLSAAIGEKADFADVSPILTAFSHMMRRGEATMNSSSGFGFDDIHETIYYRYTASAIVFLAISRSAFSSSLVGSLMPNVVFTLAAISLSST